MKDGRIRWAAIGAAVAVSLGAGGIGITQAALSSGVRSVFVAITPCRLTDTRPASQVGPKSSPIGPNETYTVTTFGKNGKCTGIPTDATALSLNVTAIGATQSTFLTVWPAGTTRPDASSLNPVPGAGPTPNAVVSDLSADGRLSVFNRQGSVDVIIDVNGYFVGHNHDDRYYTKAQVDGMLVPRGYGQVRVIGVLQGTIYWDMAFVGDHPGFLSARTPGGGITCLTPDPAVLTLADLKGLFLQDASGNDTRLYPDASFGCDADEFRIVQRSELDGSLTNQDFNVLVP